MRAACYLRISQDRAGEGLGIDRQRQDCEQLIERRGWTLQKTYIDNDISATSGKRRPEWEAMMAAVDAGHVDVVVGWTIDRTLRSGRDRLRILELGRKHGIIISIVRGSDMDLSTPAGRLAADILGAVAQNEVEVKSDRQIRAQQQAAEQGRRSGGRRPFGYDKTGMIVNPDEAAAIADGYRWVQQGLNLSEVARRWNDRGLTTGQGDRKTGRPSPFKHDSVRRVLKNPRNAGYRQYRGEIMAAPAVWPAVIDEGTWADVVDILSRPERRTATTGAKQLLTGVAECGVCTQLVHGGGASHRKRIYRCRSNRHVNRMAAPVDEYVLHALLALLGRDDAYDYLVDREKPDLDALRTEANRLRKRLDEIAHEFAADPDVSPAQARVMSRGVNTRLAEIEAKMVDHSRADLLAPFLGLSDKERAAKLEDAGVPVRRTLVAALMRVVVYPAGRGTRTFRPETVEITER